MNKPLTSRRTWLVATALLMMSIFPVYRNVEYGLALTQYGRQKAFFEGDIEFYNPWQYRVLCPLICEGLYIAYTNTFDKIVPVANFFPGDRPEVLRYYVVFVLFRIALHLLLFVLCWYWYRFFIQNKLLIYLGFGLLTLAMGNAVRDSDFSFNTYVDVILYVCAGLVTIRNASVWWIVLISFLGALNRETALLIPFLYLSGRYALVGKRKITALPVLPAAVAFVVFMATALLIRMYYGYRPVDWQIPLAEVLKNNLTGARGFKTIFELFGSLVILPWFAVWSLKRTHVLLQNWFWALVPVWFVVHLGYTAAWESRLFLVPLVLLFLPIGLQLVEQYYSQQKHESVA